jgi:hypothetical protein
MNLPNPAQGAFADVLLKNIGLSPVAISGIRLLPGMSFADMVKQFDLALARCPVKRS